MKTTLTFLLLSLFLISKGQNDFNPEDLGIHKYTLNIKTFPPDSLKFPFERIKIIDSRFDTSKLGFEMTKNIFTRRFNRISLEDGNAQGIEQFYNGYYKGNFTAAKKELLIVIKTLWIDPYPQHGSLHPALSETKSTKDIHFKFEYYLGDSEGYVPLLKVDSTFHLTSRFSEKFYDPSNEDHLPFLCFALEQMTEIPNYRFFVSQLSGKKKKSLQEIESYNHKREELPVLQNGLKKGVFLTFEEFRNNNPSVTSFSKQRGFKGRTYIILDDKHNEIVNYFAYFTGEALGIKPDMNSFLAARNLKNVEPPFLNRSGNSYEFFMIDAPDDTTGDMNTTIGGKDAHIQSPGFLRFVNGPGTILVPRIIDMETGEIY